MEYQYNIAGHLCRIVFCDAGNDSSLLPSFSPFESEEEGNLLDGLCLRFSLERENTLLPPGVCAGGSFCTVAAMSGKHDSERERIGKFCLALAVRIDHEMGPPYSFGALRHHFGHHPPFADIPFRMQAG